MRAAAVTLWAPLLASLLALLLATPARAACPSYTASSSANTHMCAIEAVPGTNPTTAAWQPIFDAVAHGTAAGPTIANIPSGCSPSTPVPAQFPCELLKAIAMNESGWKQFCVPTTPADQVGKSERTIIAFDCGYGIAQVTSGMHVGETPSFDRMQVAADAAYNLATGSQILAGKWRGAACVGDRRPTTVEHWYTATWAYNGLAYSNNPNNPNFDAMRPVCDPNVGCPNRPYQERVFGWVEHPPSAAHWTGVPLAYPDRADIPDMPGVTPQKVPALPEPDCAGPTDCVNHRSPHVSTCFATPSPTPSPEPPDLGQPQSDASAGSDGGNDGGGEPDTMGVQPGGCGCNLGGRRPSFAFMLLAMFLLVRASKRK
jgi:hypothetical protein